MNVCIIFDIISQKLCEIDSSILYMYLFEGPDTNPGVWWEICKSHGLYQNSSEAELGESLLYLQFISDPPENCHLTVKKLPKT